MTANEALITLNKLCFHYQNSDKPVLDNISFTLYQNDFLAITGPSGSGKSTLLSILGLMQKGYQGEYLLCDTNVGQLTEQSLANLKRHAIGFVFQNFNLLGHLTVYENVALPLTYRRDIKRHNYRQLVNEALQRVGMADYTSRFPAQLSGGQQQRIAIARAVVTQPQLLLADEPTGNLDSVNSAKVMQLLAQLHQEGTTICLITHDNDCANLAQRVIRLKDGQVTATQ
jgi:putative ABC transport system ATP-binding protein